MQPDSIVKKKLNNWSVDYDEYCKVYVLVHYVGGEDGYTCYGEFETRAEAEAEVAKANAAGMVHTHHIYY